jgi:hypothetical protein
MRFISRHFEYGNSFEIGFTPKQVWEITSFIPTRAVQWWWWFVSNNEALLTIPPKGQVLKAIGAE